MKLADWLATQDPPVKPAEFRRRVGIDAPMMSRLLNGKRKPSLDVAAKIEQETGGAVGLKDWTSDADGEQGSEPGQSSDEAAPPKEAAA